MTGSHLAVAGAVSLALAAFALAQQTRVAPENLHERIYIVVPMTGSGTYADPKRPLIAPTDDQMRPRSGSGSGIISWSYQTSDDGKLAIVEIVARDPAVISALANDSRILKSFERGRDRKADVERELRVFRRSFSISAPSLSAPEVKKP
jgi:hypothetical protein